MVSFVKRDPRDLTRHLFLGQVLGDICFKGDSHVLAAADVEMADHGGEAQLGVVRPLEADSIRLGVVSHGERQGTWFVDIAVTKPNMVAFGSWKNTEIIKKNIYLSIFPSGQPL